MQDSASSPTKNYIITLASPILDMIAETDSYFIENHNLNSEKIRFDKTENLITLKDFRKTENIKYIPGGAGFNTMRTTNWLSKRESVESKMGQITIGCIGEDNIADILKENLERENCEYFFEKIEGKLTSQCGVAISNKERYLIPIIEASQLISENLLKRCIENKLFENKEIEVFFNEGFFAITSYEGLKSFVDHFYSNQKKIATSLTLCTSFTLTSEEKYFNVKNILNKTHFIFCNINELRDLIFAVMKYEKNETYKRLDFTENLNEKNLIDFDFEFAKKLSEFLYSLLDAIKDRHIIITWNKNPVVYSKFDYESNRIEFIYHVKVNHIPKEEIIDTNGCGDGI